VNQVERGMSIALAASLLSDAPRCGLRLGASLFHGSRLLSIGANRWHTHPASHNTKEFDRTLHAEAVALLRRQHYSSPRRLTLFVARKHEDGSLGCSKPCANCMALARLAGVRRIWFYDQNGQSKEALL